MGIRRKSHRWQGRVASVGWLTASAGAVVALSLGVLAHQPDSVETWVCFAGVALALSYSAVGRLIVSRGRGVPIGWLLLALGLAFGLRGAATEYALLALQSHPTLPGGAGMAWAQSWVVNPVFPAGLPLLLLLFPDGKLPSRRWRPVVLASLGAGLLITVENLTAPGRLSGGIQLDFGIDNPTAIALPAPLDVISQLGWPLIAISTIASAVALVRRYRRGTGYERQQLKWLSLVGIALGLTLVLAVALVLSDQVAGKPLAATAFPEGVVVLLMAAEFAVALPAAIGVAILKHRLYDVDRLISRSLAYGLLTIAVVAVYAGLVAGLGLLIHQRNEGLAAVAAATVAIALAPVRDRFQRAVDRLLYGQRGDPYAVVAGLGRRLEGSLPPEQVLPAVAETVARALKLPFVAITVDSAGGAIIAESGHQVDEVITLPITYRGEGVGRLTAGMRSPGESFNAVDMRLLTDLARQIGPAARTVELNGELRLSRQRIVATREEERRRLRRDLHDGLGPALAGVSLRLSSIRSALPPGSPELAAVIQARSDLKQAMGDLRRIVNDLRPPVLDQLGLHAAISAIAEQLGGNGTDVTVRFDEEFALDNLPAAVEVAAYRIAQEALTNVQRHARARHCVVRLSGLDALRLEVIDDGQGIPAGHHAGVGLASMRERSEEVGGSLVVGPGADSGTSVVADLPLAAR